MEILQNSGGTLSLDDFCHHVSHHPLLKDKGSSRSKATGYQQLVEELVQHRHVRRVMALVKTSVRFKIPALQVYNSNDAQLPPSMYPFRLLPKVPLSNQVQSFIHQCGSYGCTSADITERLRVPKKTLERILAQLNDNEVSTSRQCYGNNKTIVYISKITRIKNLLYSKSRGVLMPAMQNKSPISILTVPLRALPLLFVKMCRGNIWT